jgi:hypothetical protein
MSFFSPPLRGSRGSQVKTLIFEMFLKLMKIGIKHDKSTIEVLNLLSTDAANIEAMTYLSSYLVIGPFKAIIIIIILVRRVSPLMLTGLFLFLLMVPLQIGLSHLSGRLKYLHSKLTQEIS